jgi:hypothetical protein
LGNKEFKLVSQILFLTIKTIIKNIGKWRKMKNMRVKKRFLKIKLKEKIKKIRVKVKRMRSI